jgi:archaellum component FlaC
MTIEELRTEMQAGFRTVDEELVAIRTEMKAGFSRVDEQFSRVDDRFSRVDAQFSRMDDRFTRVEEQFSRMDDRFTRVEEQFSRVDDRFTRVEDEFKSVRAEIKAEGEATRRHFDIVAEDMKDLIKIVAEATAQNTQRLNDHETRLTTLEKPRA